LKDKFFGVVSKNLAKETIDKAVSKNLKKLYGRVITDTNKTKWSVVAIDSKLQTITISPKDSEGKNKRFPLELIEEYVSLGRKYRLDLKTKTVLLPDTDKPNNPPKTEPVEDGLTDDMKSRLSKYKKDFSSDKKEAKEDWNIKIPNKAKLWAKVTTTKGDRYLVGFNIEKGLYRMFDPKSGKVKLVKPSNVSF